ncbi:hypothetical protein ACJ41O_012581 [Fusarium nematophilum]
MKITLSRPVAEALAAVNNATQFLFTALLITIFIVAWLVQGGSIDMPEWTKDMRHLSEDEWTKYAAVLSSCVCVVFALFAAAGLALMRSESVHGYSGR